MSAYQNWINEYFSANPNLIYPTSRMNEMKQSFLNNGLLDLSVSRTTFS
jgi:methionyl-tRNA synthetase